MKPSISDFLTASLLAALAGLGGAGAVYSGYDDAPGGVLISLLLIIGAAVLGWRALQRRRRRTDAGL